MLAGAAALRPLLAWSGAGVERPIVHLGVISERNNQPDFVLAKYTPLVEHLRRQLEAKGIAVGELRIARDIAELERLIRMRQVDLVLEGVLSSFRLNSHKKLVEPVLAAWRKGRRETSTVFFVRRNSNIAQLGDLAGKILALESPRSTTAYALPKIVLRQRGLRVEALDSQPPAANAVRYVLAESEENQAYWVDSGRADAGAFNTGDWEELPEVLSLGLRIIHTSEPILRWLLSMRLGIRAAVREPVLTAFLEMHASSEGVQALQAASRIRQFDALGPEDRASLAHWQALALRTRFGE
jgi:phosphonate transport system substrate-binding protein